LHCCSLRTGLEVGVGLAHLALLQPEDLLELGDLLVRVRVRG